jgi:hypothetical protein
VVVAHGGGGDGFVVVGLDPVQQQVFSGEGSGDIVIIYLTK